MVGWLLNGTQPGARNWTGGLTGVNVRAYFGAGIRGLSGENIKSHAWPGLVWRPD